MRALPLGKAQIRRRGVGIAFLAFGPMVGPALEAAHELDATVVNMRFVKPLDEDMVLELAKSHDLLVTVDENAIQGGAGSAVNECLMAHGVEVEVLNHGLPDRFIEHGSRADMLRDAGLDTEGILRAVRAVWGNRPPQRDPARLIS